MRVVPNEKEVKEFKQYERDRKPLEILSDEDKFMYSVSTRHGLRHSNVVKSAAAMVKTHEAKFGGMCP